MCVRRPADLPACSRSQPSMAPRAAATTSRIRKAYSGCMRSSARTPTYHGCAWMTTARSASGGEHPTEGMGGVDRLEGEVPGDQSGAGYHALVLLQQRPGIGGLGSARRLEEMHGEGDGLGLVLTHTGVAVALGVPDLGHPLPEHGELARIPGLPAVTELVSQCVAQLSFAGCAGGVQRKGVTLRQIFPQPSSGPPARPDLAERTRRPAEERV